MQPKPIQYPYTALNPSEMAYFFYNFPHRFPSRQNKPKVYIFLKLNLISIENGDNWRALSTSSSQRLSLKNRPSDLPAGPGYRHVVFARPRICSHSYKQLHTYLISKSYSSTIPAIPAIHLPLYSTKSLSACWTLLLAFGPLGRGKELCLLYINK